MLNFCHSGDIGDIIYCLPTIKALGGGNLYLEGSPNRWNTKFSRKDAFALKPLLEIQPYINKVEIGVNRNNIDCHLDDFRHKMQAQVTLADMHLDYFNLCRSERNWKWLNVDPKPCDVVVNCTARYSNDNFDWKKLLNRFRSRCIFLGHPDEHTRFCEIAGKIDYYPTADLLEAARLIAGSRLYIGNQSSLFAICEGLKHNSILQVCPRVPNCLFGRENAGYYFAYPQR